MRAMAVAVASCTLLAGTARGEIRTEELEYRQGDTVLQGFLAWDDAAKGPRPGVLVIHEWWGHNQHARDQALRLARAGYVGLAVDMYGKGKTTTHPEDAQKFVAEATSDAARIRARFDAGRALLQGRPQVDRKRIAAIGYCFGGMVALEMAREGADLAAVATFHAGIRPPATPAAKGKVKAAILVQTGGADPMVSPEALAGLEREMKAAGARIEVISYPGVKHSFTNPDAGKAGMEALAYDADADARSWAAMLAFFKRTLGA
jgi:dienelactone hydrolase